MQALLLCRSLGFRVRQLSGQLPAVVEWILLEAVWLLWAAAAAYICLEPPGCQSYGSTIRPEPAIVVAFADQQVAIPSFPTNISCAMDRVKSLIDRRLQCLRRELLGSPPSVAASSGAAAADARKTSPEKTPQDLVSCLHPIVAPFIQSLGYRPSPKSENEKLWAESLAKAENMGLACPEGSSNWKRLKVGYSYAHYCYPLAPLEVQVYVTVYTLLAQCLDDFTPEGLADIEGFYPRFCAGTRQPTATLEGWTQMMREAYAHWDPIAANLIVSATLNMVTSTIIEHRRLISSGALSRGGRGWAYYLRNMDGLGDAFAVFTFPKALYPDVSQFLEAVPDMARYIVHANDIISFYKEELQGERDNYVHTRAQYEGKSVLATLGEVVDETAACCRRIHAVLADGGTVRRPYAAAWRVHELGYVDFHGLSGRYRLEELGLTFSSTTAASVSSASSAGDKEAR